MTVLHNGIPSSDLDTIKNEAVRFYKKKLFTEDFKRRPTMSNLDFKKISSLQASNLIAPFTHEEIDLAVNSCNPSKSPGPDGFNFKFIKSS